MQLLPFQKVLIKFCQFFQSLDIDQRILFSSGPKDIKCSSIVLDTMCTDVRVLRFCSTFINPGMLQPYKHLQFPYQRPQFSELAL